MSGRTAADAWRAVVSVLRRARDAQRRRDRDRGRVSRTVTAAVCAMAGMMIVISATHAQGTDLRPARNTDLVSLVQSQSRRNAELTRQLTSVRKDVDGLAARGTDQSDLSPDVSRESRRVGLTAVTGPGVTVILDDAPASVAANGIEPDLLVVHQQDIQAVVNALWSGGAEAMTIQEQRVISTTAVKCVGNTVVLHGIPYAPPYRIRAIGDQERLHAALASSEPIQIYQQYVAAYGLVFREKSEERLELPGHEGSLDLTHALPYSGFGVRSTTRRPLGENDRVSIARILVIDNYDSFVYNLVQYLAQIGAEVDVWRNDDPRFDDPDFPDAFDGILLSPGPGTPEEAGVCVDVVRTQAGRLPIFGVCLGLQAIGVAYGGVVDRAPELLHGKTSLIQHQGLGVLAGLPSPFTATRYHSLAIEPDDTACGAGGNRNDS